ncbi:MAG TPA: glycosyl hydrolase family 18 protein [Actinomycetes bacterium]|nr:glycosyl hydrolase family 18 protein [Actinomycetes bacterium]
MKPKRFVTGWLPYWNTDGAIRSVKNNASVFDDASPFVFNTLATRRIDLEISADSWRKMRSALRTSGVDNIPTVATDMSAADFAWILRSADRRTAHVRALVSLVDRYNLDGIDLDYESINFGSSTDKNTIREKYPLLVRQLNERLNKLGAVTSVTVASRTSTKDPNWWVFDYRALGAAADRIRLMTYDFSWSGGPAGPIAPKWWVRDVAAYASSVIEPSKISLGMPAYGRDWYHHTISGKCSSAAKNTISRTTRQMNAFARNLGKTPEWRERQSSQTFTYTRTYRSDGRSCKVQRVVWFDDARSLEAKVPLVEQYSLRGIAIWALGNEGAGTWSGLTSYGRQLARSR